MANVEVIVVDDNLESMRAVTNALDNLGISYLTINDSTVALEAAIQHQPELAILDYMMPDLDGIELRDKLRSHPKTAHIEVIFMTAVSSIDDLLIDAKVKHESALSKTQPIGDLINVVLGRKLERGACKILETFIEAQRADIRQHSAH